MVIPAYIDRFKILNELRRDSQGVVYLASDTRLERNIAIKILHKKFLLQGDKQERLLREVKAVSKLQHPNIVTLYEAGQDHDQLFLVFEYVDGISLKEQIRKSGVFVVHKAVKLMVQILDGIYRAHEQGIIHRDLNPSNILIDKNGLPRIMDFGISVVAGKNDDTEKYITGTPFYKSPEHFSNKGPCIQSDIFSLGLIFYEMLLARPAIKADNEFTITYKIENEKIAPPSTINNTIDKELDRILMKALESNLETRYSRAIEMKNDLEEYLNEKSEGTDKGDSNGRSHSTLDFLLRKIRYKSDFPTFSHNIMEINKKASVSQVNVASASELANAVLKDYSLTNKLLKLVNSAFYGQFAGKITTVSRAVVVLGFEQVSMAASSLMLFNQLKNKNQKEVLSESAVSSCMSGVIAKELARNIGVDATEEAFICSMLRNLGKHLVLFYFEEEHSQITNLMAGKGISEDFSAKSVLGMTYEELGTGIANSWKFPKKIVNSMIALPKGKINYPKTEEEKLRQLSSFSNELCSIINSPDDEESREELTKLLKRFENSIHLNKKQVAALLESAREKVGEFSEIYNVNLKKSQFIKQVENFSKTQRIEVHDFEKPVEKTAPVYDSQQEYYDDVSLPETLSDAGEVKDPQQILINGIQDITNTLLEEFNLNDILTMILETMYRGFSFNRVLFSIMNVRKMEMRGSFGLGKDIENVVEHFRFKVNKSPDVFNFAVLQAKDIGVFDSKDERFKKRIPEWYIENIFAPAFVLYPLVVNKKVIGMFYADRELSGTVLSGTQVNYMKTLCNQAVLAIKQSR